MSNEVILNLSFDNQTVTDLTGNWTLDGTPNATYEQIDGRDGYSLVTGSLGRCIVLNAVDQNTVYNEYTVDFDMFVKSTYTSDYYIYTIIYMWSRINPGTEYSGEIGNVLNVCLKIGGSEQVGTTNYSPIGRWVHVTLTSGPTEVDDQYRTTAYVDGVKLIDRTDDTYGSGANLFALSKQILLLTRDTEAKLMPNGPGICLNTFKVVTGIHMPDQNPAISLFNLSRVFNNFCTWLKRQLSTVAFTGSYNDLSNKPTISTVNNGTLTIQQNGTTVDSFTANSSSNKTVNIQCVDLSTAQTVGGQKTFTSNIIIQGSKRVTCTLDNSFIELDGGTTWGKGGSIVLSGQDRSSYTNSVLIVSKSDTNTDILQYQNGELKPLSNNTNNSSLGTPTNKWSKVYSDDVVHTTGDETVGGNKEFTGTTTAHDLVPSATDTYNFGSPSYQWNNAYIKSLTINGVATGDILTHNASEFVGVSGNQTIVGVKSFKDVILRNVGNFTAGVAPTAQTTCLVLKHTNNDGTQNANSILSYMFTSGESMCELTQNPCIGSIARTWFRTNTDGTYSIYSYTKNGSLGILGYRWKDVQTEKINGINPGALNLPGASVNVDTTNWVLDGSGVNIFTPASDGWLGIQATDTVYDQMHYAFVGRTGGGNTYYQQNIISPINALWDNKYHGSVFIPVIKNMPYHIRCICGSIVATFYPCQGNV